MLNAGKKYIAKLAGINTMYHQAIYVRSATGVCRDEN